MAEEWYSPRDIIFTREQNIWLLNNLELISSGRWPADPRPTGYTGGSKGKSQRAPFEVPCQISGELLVRVETTGRDGLMLLAYYRDNWELERIAKLVQCDESQVQRKINSSLWYCCGWRRKLYSYEDFKNHRKRWQPVRIK